VWNYWLGGTDNFPVDRELAERVMVAMPSMPLIARFARLFLADAVRRLSEFGIRQFLDIGSGVPTADNTRFFDGLDVIPPASSPSASGTSVTRWTPPSATWSATPASAGSRETERQAGYWSCRAHTSIHSLSVSLRPAERMSASSVKYSSRGGPGANRMSIRAAAPLSLEKA
jgi:S-adenosyl methyltransferase